MSKILFLFIAGFLLITQPSYVRSELYGTMSDEVEEVERIILGTRGTLTFSNKVSDVIEGVSCGIVYLTRSGEAPTPVIELDGFIIDRVWYKDLTGDGLNEIAVSWKSTSSFAEYRFQIFQVTVSGRLENLFPLEGDNPYPSRGNPVFPGEGMNMSRGTAFVLTRLLSQISQERPLLTAVTEYTYSDGRFRILKALSDEPETVGQRLNLAAHHYSMGNFKRGLALARNALEGIRAFGPRNLLGKAYLLVARGYEKCGRTELAALYNRRAALTVEE